MSKKRESVQKLVSAFVKVGVNRLSELSKYSLPGLLKEQQLIYSICNFKLKRPIFNFPYFLIRGSISDVFNFPN